MVKQCVSCKYGHLRAKHMKPGQKVDEQWECDKGHKIDNPRKVIDCDDFEEKP
jgi:hypothetical protein